MYSDWVDACDAVAKDNGPAGQGGGEDGLPARGVPAARPRGSQREERARSSDDDLIDDADASDEGMDARYAGGGAGVAADDDEF